MKAKRRRKRREQNIYFGARLQKAVKEMGNSFETLGSEISQSVLEAGVWGSFTKRFQHKIPFYIPDKQINKYIRLKRKKNEKNERNENERNEKSM